MNATNMPQINALRDELGHLPAYAWPGGYPIYYLAADNGTMCPKCANSTDCNRPDLDPECPDDDQWRIVAYGIHWEGAPIICANCNSEIESAYGDPDNPDDD
jgi:hypothetical protein